MLLQAEQVAPAETSAVCVCVCVCGDGWLILCVLITQRTTGVQPHPAPDSNQPDWGQVRLLKPATHHTPHTRCHRVM